MVWVGATLALTLWGVALLHLYWALGGLWPARSADELARMVVGRDRAGAMPGPGLTLVVAGLIAGAGFWPLIFLDLVAGAVARELVVFGMWALVLVFALRALVSYLPGPWQMGQTTEFRRLNRRYFAPLIGSIAVGYLILLLG